MLPTCQLCNQLLHGPHLPGLVGLLRQCPFPGPPPGLAFSWAGLRHRNAPAQDARGKVSTGPCFPSSLPGTGLGTGAPFISAGEETEAQVWLPNLEAGADHQTSEPGYMALAPNTEAGRKGHTAVPLSPLPGMESLGPSLQTPPNLRETKTAGHRSTPFPPAEGGRGWTLSASGQSAGPSQCAPCAQRRSLPLGCGLPWASGDGASSALTVSPDAMCCLAGSQQMPRRALSCCPAGDRTDSHPAPFLGSCGDSGCPESVKQDTAHPWP